MRNESFSRKNQDIENQDFLSKNMDRINAMERDEVMRLAREKGVEQQADKYFTIKDYNEALDAGTVSEDLIDVNYTPELRKKYLREIADGGWIDELFANDNNKINNRREKDITFESFTAEQCLEKIFDKLHYQFIHSRKNDESDMEGYFNHNKCDNYPFLDNGWGVIETTNYLAEVTSSIYDHNISESHLQEHLHTCKVEAQNCIRKYPDSKETIERFVKHLESVVAHPNIDNDVKKLILQPDLLIPNILYPNQYRELATIDRSIYPTANKSDFKFFEKSIWDGVSQLCESYLKRGKTLENQSGPSFSNIEDMEPTFIHFNTQNRNSDNIEYRVYLSSNHKRRDQFPFFNSFSKAINQSPLRDQLQFKVMNCVEIGGKRADDIVIYKSRDIDDAEFASLITSFQDQCAEISDDILPSDSRQMPTAANIVANGITLAPEPNYANAYQTIFNESHPGTIYSWTTFIDQMALLSSSLACNRLGKKPQSPDYPGFKKEAKDVFRQLVVIFGINPNTMMESDDNTYPGWVSEVRKHQKEISK